MALGTLFRKSAVAAAMLLGSLHAPAATAADYILQVAPADAGFCSTPGVLGRIKKNFQYQVTHVPHLPNVAILDFQNITLRRWLPAIPEERPIARLYCGGIVQLSDGMQRNIWYLIEEGMGFAGTGYNVEFCVDGFDRWNVYSGACRVLR
ncbi:hypothetical protein [Tianweitania sediminis]|jgi:hypothetical protein|uniref:Uncharacterized protein n=1 Tax=Tianweitania sediminis TaxID=1502156 RepID=A0A8J7R2G4_9HYPH|nr:hypothetical protein [Tianweitania sediminis]MBP0439030.1 hypothetical protein [Tianweitania sediminis]HEV7416728.1 hypothetical protein [Tianweitania sediminis]